MPTAPTLTPSNASLGYGAIFSTGVLASGSVTYTAVANIASISFEGFTVPEVDVTNLLSPNMTKESIPGLLTPGSISLTGQFTNDAGQAELVTLGTSRTVFPFEVTAALNGGKTYTLQGNGYVTKLSRGPFEADKSVEFKADIKVSGAFLETIA
jgi:hypothetical protein